MKTLPKTAGNVHLSGHAWRSSAATAITRIALATMVLMAALPIGLLSRSPVVAHEGHDHVIEAVAKAKSDEAAIAEAQSWFRCLSRFIEQWPSAITDDLIQHAYWEHQVIHGTDFEIDPIELKRRRETVLGLLESTLLTVHFKWLQTAPKGITLSREIATCNGIDQPMLVVLQNQTDREVRLTSELTYSQTELPQQLETVFLAPQSTLPIIFKISLPVGAAPSLALELRFKQLKEGDPVRTLSIPVKREVPGTLRALAFGNGDDSTACRVTVRCSDGVCRYGGEFAKKNTFTDKPVIYPPIGTSQKTPFFYCNRPFEMDVPPGKTVVTIERGFEHKRSTIEIDVKAGQTHEVELSCERAIDMASQGWIAGDTHVHWVTNQWNVDEPLELLAMAQRAEDLRVVNNLTLLQRYANQAFIKPSQAAMGPVTAFCDKDYHVHMGEEYRNEDLYGHLCFLNIDWLVQPIGTGSIIAGPDALDYPINRTAIEACREQGGISIEAHGTGGNKDVPVNVIHNLADSLDQMEPDMYYRLLDCGFHLPLTNGSDHPARTLGIARAYVKVDGPFTYDRWIEGIRLGRTFTTSGPLLFLTVNGKSIGDVIHAGASEKLQVKASVISRDPIGRFQIVSNGQVIAEKATTETTAELEVVISAEESRWIVARCSNRTNGRADYGFGDFNAITGPGIAHTSPVYVQVAGLPRFDSSAAEFWAARMRLHQLDILNKGRFANAAQRDEASGYIENGIVMFRSLEKEIRSARNRHESLEESKSRLSNVVRRFGNRAEADAILPRIAASDSRRTLRKALAPVTLLSASVNPESRVKISTNRDRLELQQGRPQRFLLHLENTAGITAPLGIQVVDLASEPPRPAAWCDIRVVDSPFTSVYCTGAESEYKVIEILSREGGLREVRLVADAGQGTQDLGFRATADILIDTKPRHITAPYEN